MTILRYIFTALEVVVLFNLLIGVHELGHFLAAKWRGLKIERFAIWFGKPIWKKKINGVEYALGWIPAGGYVALPQMATMEAIEGKPEDAAAEPLPNIPPLDKIIVAFAGPLFSFGLAVFFAFIVWGVGRPVETAGDSTVIGWVDPAGPAWAAGLRAGDTILAVDGHPVKNFMPTSSFSDSIKWRIITSTGTNVAIKYLRDGKEAMAYPVPTNPPTKWYERRSLRQISIAPAEKFVIADIVSNSPAALAGLKSGDEIVALNGQKILSPDAYFFTEQALTNKPDSPVAFTVKRGNEQFERTLRAVKPLQPTNSQPSFGILSWLGETNVTLAHPNPWRQISESSSQIFSTIGALFAPKSQIGVQQLGGAVMIIRVYSNLFQDEDGWRRVLWFSVILNVNLALLNML
ncbi:MAG TPA: RIP metalloprotease RseP, partial [Candidatus Paceibacterota bacterium]|nr:RIP metalloprotease RseP [Candidatus Paceibacterota bacterium]